MKMAASSSSQQREWEVVSKKWHDFASAAKERGAAVRRDWARTGGGPSFVPALTPDEEKAMAILGEAASQGISWGIDLRAGVDTTFSQLSLFTFTPCSQSTPSLIHCTPMPSPPASSGWILQHRRHHTCLYLHWPPLRSHSTSNPGVAPEGVLLSDVTAVKSWRSLKRRSWKCCRGSRRVTRGQQPCLVHAGGEEGEAPDSGKAFFAVKPHVEPFPSFHVEILIFIS